MLEPTAPSPYFAAPALEPALFEPLRRRALLECCKWDPQVGDVGTLARFPLILSPAAWEELSLWAERLTAETLLAEEALLRAPRSWKRLGVPRRIRHVLERVKEEGSTPAAARVMRFDFHWTREGWRISEVNSDVPGGFTEASSFTRMMAEHYATADAAGDPAGAWSGALARSAGPRGVLALLSAPGFMEDQQIMAYLARHLTARGLTPHLADPTQLSWDRGSATLRSGWYQGPVDAIVRFYQAEWLGQLDRRIGWSNLFCGGRVPVGNPGRAVLTESKRFPLTWDELGVELPAWRRLLPETRDPRRIRGERAEDWIFKSAYGNTGEEVAIPGLLSPTERRALRRELRLHPGRWVAQRRFEPIALETPVGLLYPCIGVYTIDGRTTGGYARAAERPLVDFSSLDLALLVGRRPKPEKA